MTTFRSVAISKRVCLTVWQHTHKRIFLIMLLYFFLLKATERTEVEAEERKEDGAFLFSSSDE